MRSLDPPRPGSGVSRDLLPLAAMAVLVLLGALAETRAVDGGAVDLFVGIFIGMSGLVTVRRRGRDPVGWLLVVAALAWFSGSMATAPGWSGQFGQQLRFAHRAPLLLAIVVPLWPSGRPTGATTRRRWAVAACSVGALLVAIGPGAGGMLLLRAVAVGTVVVAVIGLVGGSVARPRAVWAFAIAATLLWSAAASSVWPISSFEPHDRLISYQIGVAAAAGFMAASRFRRRRLADQVVEVDRRAGLGGVLDDPGLRIGFGDGTTFLAADGSPVLRTGSQQATEFDVGADGLRVLIVHRRGLLDDARVRADVEAVSRLLVSHRRLVQEVEQHAARVDASRARLVMSERLATQAFSRDLERKVMVHIDEVVAVLDGFERDETQHARAIADEIRSELTALALDQSSPGPTRSLADVFDALAVSCPLPVLVDADPVDLDAASVRTLRFVASESLANILKHSKATEVHVQLRIVEESVVLRIDDDGVGGAVLRPEGGLSGLAERLSSAGGSLSCERRVPRGTSVVAQLPLRISPGLGADLS